MGRAKKQCKKERSLRTAVYLAPSVYGDEVDMEEALTKCREYIEKDGTLRLMRIYRDEKVDVTGTSPAKKKRQILMPIGTDAWERLMVDLQTGAVEAVVFYTARMVAPTFFYLEDIARRFFFPCGIRFADICAGFDSGGHSVEEAESLYFKSGRSMYRSTITRTSYKERTKPERVRPCFANQEYKGVRTSTLKNGRVRYMGAILIEGKTKYLGTYDTKEEAAQAYDNAARELYGNEGIYNFPRPGERSCRTFEIEPVTQETEAQEPAVANAAQALDDKTDKEA